MRGRRFEDFRWSFWTDSRLTMRERTRESIGGYGWLGCVRVGMMASYANSTSAINQTNGYREIVGRFRCAHKSWNVFPCIPGTSINMIPANHQPLNGLPLLSPTSLAASATALPIYPCLEASLPNGELGDPATQITPSHFCSTRADLRALMSSASPVVVSIRWWSKAGRMEVSFEGLRTKAMTWCF